MNLITSISPQKSDPSRVSIFIDEKFFTGISGISFSRLDLHVGDHIPEEKQKMILEQGEEDAAIDFVIKSCTRAKQTTQTIHEKLIKKNYTEPVILRAIQKGKDLNLIDDSEFIKLFMKDKTRLKNWGEKRIRIELLKKGIPSKMIDDEIRQMPELKPDFSEMRRVAVKKFSPLTDKDNYQKAVNFLQYRGFVWDEIKSILNMDTED